MKRTIRTALPFLIMLVFVPVYQIMDSLLLVDIFGCGCVPSTQTNMLNIPFNANDLRMVVFAVLTIILSLWGTRIARSFQYKLTKILYCIAVVTVNGLLTLWVVKTFMWA